MFELKHCPFCGGETVNAEVAYLHKEFRIYCASADEIGCAAEMRLSFADAGLGDGSLVDFDEMQTIMKQLVDVWNTRTPKEK